MGKTVLKRLTMLLLVVSLVLTACLTGCGGGKNPVDPVNPTIPNITQQDNHDSDGNPTELAEEVRIWSGIDASFFTTVNVLDYTGTIANKAFTGVVLQSNLPQASTTLSKEGVVAIRKYAREKGFDALRVHTYVQQANNNFTIGGQTAKNGEWTTIDLNLATLNSKTTFQSGSTSATENYMWFELGNMPVVNDSCFTKGVSPFTGTVGGVTFSGVVFRSAEYQPDIYFYDFAVDDIKAYAAKSGFNALRIHSYATQKDNAFMVGGYRFPLDTWESRDYLISGITTDFAFWSQSQGKTENYMWFEFVNSDNAVVPAGKTGPKIPQSPYFTSQKGAVAQSFSGTVEGITFEGFKITASTYQPDFYFTDRYIAELEEEATKTGDNFLRIHSYANLYNNGFVLGGTYTRSAMWATTDFAIDSIGTDFRFWSQSEGATEIYLWFETFRLDIPDKTSEIDAGYFTSGTKKDGTKFRVSFSDYAGEAGGSAINGVQVRSSEYQPSFYFTADGAAALKAAAAKTGDNFLRIHSYANLYNNGFVLGGTYTRSAMWATTDFAIDSIDTDFRFWSQSEGATEIYLWFETFHMDIPDKTSEIDAGYFTPGTKKDGTKFSVSFSDYAGEAGETTINGVQVRSSEYQPSFCFTESALQSIRSYAAANDVDMLQVMIYPILYNNAFALRDSSGTQTGYARNKKWTAVTIPVSALSTEMSFWSQSEGATEVYLTFSFYKAPLISDLSFQNNWNSTAMTFVDAVDTETTNGLTYTGVYAQQAANLGGYVRFTEDAVSKIQAYAAENGMNTLRIGLIKTKNGGTAAPTNGGNMIDYRTGSRVDVIANDGNNSYFRSSWKYWDIAVDELTTTYPLINLQQEDTKCEVNMTFALVQVSPITSEDLSGEGAVFEDYTGTIGDVTFTGVKITGTQSGLQFGFTDKIIAKIRAYAAEKGFDYLKIHAYADLANGDLSVNDEILVGTEWAELSVSVDDLTKEFVFTSGSTSASEIYLFFDFASETVIETDSFAGGFVYETFEGNIGGRTVAGFKTAGEKVTRGTFTADAVEKIKAYAEQKGYTTLVVETYVTLENNNYTVNGVQTKLGEWDEIKVDLSKLTSKTRFQTTTSGKYEIYLVFSFE